MSSARVWLAWVVVAGSEGGNGGGLWCVSSGCKDVGAVATMEVEV